MNIASKVWIVSFLTRLIVIIIIGKVLGLILLWSLPNEGIDFYEQKRVLPPYQPYTVDILIDSKTVSKGSKSEAKYIEVGIGTMILKGLYSKNKTGYIIIALQSNPTKTEILGIGESYGGYKLVEIKPSSAVFEKGSNNFILELITDNLSSLRKKHAPFIEGQPYHMSRAEIKEYAKNFGQILEDINIIEVKNRGKLKGFKITRIRSNTPFSYLGLKKGDVIIKINNEPLRSYADALNIYQNIDDIKEIELIVLRNNKEKELRYEIY